MKKIYLTLFTLAAAVTAVFAQTVPTCSLNPTFIASNKIGVWPDSATNFISGMVGVPYEQNITIKVPKDTTAGPITLCFNRFVLSTPSGNVNYSLPPGLIMGSSTAAVANGTVNGAPSFKFPGNANNCASIYGTPTTVGSYTLAFNVEAFATPAFAACPSTPNVTGGQTVSNQTLKYYIINIAPNNVTALRDIDTDKITLSQNFPNPSSTTTDIQFYVQGQHEATVSVYNMLGDVVASKTIKTAVGENTVTINSSELAAGTYMYTLTYKGAKATKRMIVLSH
jgi:hypothetical protein